MIEDVMDYSYKTIEYYEYLNVSPLLLLHPLSFPYYLSYPMVFACKMVLTWEAFSLLHIKVWYHQETTQMYGIQLRKTKKQTQLICIKKL